MYLIHRVVLILLGIVSFIIGYFYQTESYENGYDSIITFLSILFGFSLTAFVTLFSSNFVNDLYNIRDEQNTYITLKHRLKNYFLTSFNISIVSIILLCIFPNKLVIQNVIFYKTLLVLPIIFINSCMYYILLRYLGKIFIKNKGN